MFIFFILKIHNYLSSVILSNNIYFLLKKVFYLFKVSVLKTKFFFKSKNISSVNLNQEINYNNKIKNI